ncbi:MAG TPA: 2OG-Fe dioxygenase family protein [Vicinamibacterales bacterium]|nr:2OG-Fe dioxygenase family protein [Vicinamibacterales bacterium]
METVPGAGWHPGMTFTLSIADRGYQFVPAAEMRAALEAAGSLADWREFAASWNDLAIDAYLAEGRRFRRRRFAVYAADAGGAIERQAHQPHLQALQYNQLFGGVERWFEPIAPAIGSGPTLRTVLTFCRQAFGELAPAVRRWRIEVHQFRIEASGDAPGQPTPEGVHRDGVDFVLVMLVNRDNIVSGVTTVYDPAGTPLGHFTLTVPFDATLLDDVRVAHGVTAVTPLDHGRAGYRDVLVVTFRCEVSNSGNTVEKER